MLTEDDIKTEITQFLNRAPDGFDYILAFGMSKKDIRKSILIPLKIYCCNSQKLGFDIDVKQKLLKLLVLLHTIHNNEKSSLDARSLIQSNQKVLNSFFTNDLNFKNSNENFVDQKEVYIGLIECLLKSNEGKVESLTEKQKENLQKLRSNLQQLAKQNFDKPVTEILDRSKIIDFNQKFGVSKEDVKEIILTILKSLNYLYHQKPSPQIYTYIKQQSLKILTILYTINNNEIDLDANGLTKSKKEVLNLFFTKDPDFKILNQHYKKSRKIIFSSLISHLIDCETEELIFSE